MLRSEMQEIKAELDDQLNKVHKLTKKNEERFASIEDTINQNQ